MDFRDHFDLTGRVAVVTGAASGLGFAMANAVAGAGAHVVFTDVDGDGAELAANLAREAGLRAEAMVCDVSEQGAADGLVAAVTGKHGRLDIVFANAGVTAGPSSLSDAGAIGAVDMALWHKVLGINLTGVFETMRAAAEPMKQAGWGRIIVTASTAGLRGDAIVGYPYAASKGAVANLVRQAALDLCRYGINVNGIAPGPFVTNIAGGRAKLPETQKMFAETVPMGRMGQPEELSGIALLLASEASSFITGTVIPVDGGVMAW
jgi:NAD(P)-dependent dehydrogenase (short-subunit alcohol dehydrogenase family)